MLQTVLTALGLTMEDVIVTAGSAAVVLFLIVVIYLAGFRATARLDAQTIDRLAAAEGAPVEGVVIDPSGRRALAKLAGDRLLVARVMGDEVGARVATASAASVRMRKEGVRVAFGDFGFPALDLRLEKSAPAWLNELARG